MTDPAHPDPEAAVDEVIDAAIERAIGSLPAAYAARLPSVAIVVEDEPTDEQLRSVGAAGPLGLYQGVPRTTFGAEGMPVPSKITIFRGPLLRAGRGDPTALGAIVEETVLHEIAHHFGLSDERLLELRRRP